jgi:hypothetical protein
VALLVMGVVFGGPAVVILVTGGAWDAWVLYGVVISTLLAAAFAGRDRRYTTRKRTFLRDYE